VYRGPIIREVDALSPAFQRTWKRLPDEVKKQARKAMAALLLPPEERPRKLHFHKMNTGNDSIWSIHLSNDDRYKASLSIVGDVAVMRRCGTHEEIDKNPR
jgi:mRNA-degrading endonuclease YafQ of YafQ-DinJ toxin-antitoxin module